MAHILVHHKVEDYNKWKPVFDGHGSFRSENGSNGDRVFRSANDPNEIFILFDWDTIENAQKFTQSDALKEAMKEAGVVGMPEIHFVEETASTEK